MTTHSENFIRAKAAHNLANKGLTAAQAMDAVDAFMALLSDPLMTNIVLEHLDEISQGELGSWLALHRALYLQAESFLRKEISVQSRSRTISDDEVLELARLADRVKAINAMTQQMIDSMEPASGSEESTEPL